MNLSDIKIKENTYRKNMREVVVNLEVALILVFEAENDEIQTASLKSKYNY